MVEILRELLWSKSLSGKLGRLFGALSLISLMEYAFHFGLSEASKAILTYYGVLLKVMLGWLDPSIRVLVRDIFFTFKIDIHFSELWRHIFIVLWILFARDAGVALADRRPVTAAFRLAVGLAIAVIVSVLASSTYAQVTENIQNVMIASLPVIGIYAYDVILYLYSAAFQIEYLTAWTIPQAVDG